MRQSVIANTGIASAGRVVNALIGIIVTALVARSLGVSGFGVYTSLVAYAALLQVLADGGLYLTLTGELGRTESGEHTLSQFVFLRLVLSLVIFGGGFLGLRSLPATAASPLLYGLLAVGFLAQGVSQLFMSVYQKEGSVWRASVGDILGRLAQVGTLGAGFLWLSQSRISSAVMAFSLGAVIATLVHYTLSPLKIRHHGGVSYAAWRRIMLASWPLALMLLLNTIYFRIDALFLSWWRPIAELGYYGLAYRVIDSALFFPAMFGGLLLPRLTNALKVDKEVARQWLTEALLVGLLAAGFVLVVLPLLAPALITVVAGKAFLPAVPLLRVLYIALAIMCFGNIVGFSLVGLQKQKVLLGLYVALVVINIGLNAVFIPAYGALAAAWTTVVTEALSTLGAAWFVWRYLRPAPQSFPFGAVVVALVGALVSFFIIPPAWPLVQLAVPCLVYAGLSWWLGILSRRTLPLLMRSL
jgi:O-antigen/teichoic acid export membrane protein